MPTIFFVNRFYSPDEPATAQLLTDLAESLAARGHSVTVIASRPSRSPVSSAKTETLAGVRVARVGATRWGQANLLARPVDFMTFLLGVAWQLFRRVQANDCVVAMTDPPLLGLVVAWVARMKKARVIHWVQDIYPEVAMAVSSHWAWRYLGRALRPARNLAWKKSRGCVAVSREMAAFIAQTGMPPARIATIPNWAPAGLRPIAASAPNALRAALGLQDEFVVVYSGNLGRVHDLEPIVEVAAALRAEASIAFVFVGGGAQREILGEWVKARGLRNVRFCPAQPRARLAETLALGDAHWVTLRPGCEALVFPSKLYGVAAVGRPVFVIAPPGCELAEMVAHHGFGAAYSRNQISAIAAGILQLAADPAFRLKLGLAATEFSRVHDLASAVTAWETFLDREVTC